MKREAGVGVATLHSKTEEKKARFDAGLDFDEIKDITDLQVENILKEVSAPVSILEKLVEWKKEFFKFVSDLQFKLKKKEKLDLCSLPKGYKFDGGKVSVCLPGGYLSGDLATCLVFPEAQAHITVYIKPNKITQEEEDIKNDYLFCTAKMLSHLSDCSLVCKVQAVQSGSSKQTKYISFSPNLNKIKDQLTIHMSLVLESDDESGLSKSLQEELNRLLLINNYRQATQLLEIWRRQLKIWLPESVIPLVILHLHLIKQLNSGMKVWSVVRRVWTYLSDSSLHDSKQILGLEKPVPDQDLTSPFLDRDGTRLLHPDVAKVQWLSICSFACAALTVSLKEALLVKNTPGALYDKLFRICGSDLDICKLMLDLSYALGNRVYRITTLHLSGDGVVIGLTLNPENYSHPATHGPTADEVGSLKFREFWGDRSELRRFQDGDVRETVVWGHNKQKVIKNIFLALIEKRWTGLTCQELGASSKIENHLLAGGDGGKLARKELDNLSPVLHSLEGLALSVTGVHCFGEEWRLSRVDRRLGGSNSWRLDTVLTYNEKGTLGLKSNGNMVPSYVPAVDVMLQTGFSGKWPKDGPARRRLQVAWLSEVGDALEMKVKGLKQRILGENLIVLTPSQEAIFRFHVGRPGRGRIGGLCELTSWLGSVAVGAPAFSAGVRIAKRWVSAHLLADIIPDTAVEAIMARVFLIPGQFGYGPVDGISAFHRWLQIISSHDWNESPLTVSPDITFSGHRKDLPAMAIITPKDPSPGYWCSPGPSWVELNRLVSLATASQLILQSQDGETEHIKAFIPNLSSYEFLIQLDDTYVANTNIRMDAKLKTEDLTEKVKYFNIPVLEYNPVVTLVQQLNTSYSNIAKFYYDKYGGSVIAVKLKKIIKSGEVVQGKPLGEMLTLTKRKKRLVDIVGHISRGQETEVNWGAIVEDWKILADPMISSVKCQDSTILS